MWTLYKKLVDTLQNDWGAVAQTKTNIDNTASTVNTNLDAKVSLAGGIDFAEMEVSNYYHTTAEDTKETIVDISGRGVAVVALRSSSTTSSNHARAWITVDGSEISDAASQSLCNRSDGPPSIYGVAGDPIVENWAIPYNGVVIAPPYIGFENSFLFEVQTTGPNQRVIAMVMIYKT